MGGRNIPSPICLQVTGSGFRRRIHLASKGVPRIDIRRMWEGTDTSAYPRNSAARRQDVMPREIQRLDAPAATLVSFHHQRLLPRAFHEASVQDD